MERQDVSSGCTLGCEDREGGEKAVPSRLTTSLGWLGKADREG